MPYSAPPTVSAGQIYTPTMYNTYLQGNADSGYMRMIADSTAVGAVASFDFASIPQTFAHLMVVLEARGDTAGNLVSACVRFNNDSGASQYSYAAILNTSASADGTLDNTSNTLGLLGAVPAAAAAAQLAGTTSFTVQRYAGGTLLKRWLAQYGTQYASTTGAWQMGLTSGFWNSSAAITRVTLFPASGNFVAGSRATIYGLPQ